jgi:hypothetical protein
MESSFAWWQWVLIVIGSSLAGVLAGLGAARFIQRLQKKSWQGGLNRLDNIQIYPAMQSQVAAPGAPLPAAPGASVREERPAAGAVSNDKLAERKKSDAVEQYLKSRTSPPDKLAPIKKPIPQPKIEPPRKTPRPVARIESVASKPVAPPPRAEPFKSAEASAPRPEPVPVHKSELVKEVEGNLATAVTASSGKMSAFQSGAFDSSRSRLNSISDDLADMLTEAYTDIRLANTLVWLSKDLGRQSNEMESGYLRLCGKISERLQKALPELLRAGI